MKFGHDLLLLEAGAPDSLRGQFIQYKQLKKLLKQLPAAEDRTEAEQEFFRRLRAEVQAVNQCATPCRGGGVSMHPWLCMIMRPWRALKHQLLTFHSIKKAWL